MIQTSRLPTFVQLILQYTGVKSTPMPEVVKEEVHESSNMPTKKTLKKTTTNKTNSTKTKTDHKPRSK